MALFPSFWRPKFWLLRIIFWGSLPPPFSSPPPRILVCPGHSGSGVGGERSVRSKKNYSGEFNFWFSEIGKKFKFETFWTWKRHRITQIFSDGPFPQDIQKIQKFQNSQLLDSGKKSSIEKNLIIRSFALPRRSRNLQYFQVSEDQIFDSSE